MKSRLKKKAEKHNRRMIHQLLDLALDINGLSSRSKELTGNKPTVFMYFSGHIAQMQVCIHRSGWEAGKGYDCEITARTNNSLKLASAIELLKNETPTAQTAGESREL